MACTRPSFGSTRTNRGAWFSPSSTQMPHARSSRKSQAVKLPGRISDVACRPVSKTNPYRGCEVVRTPRSEEHTSELQSLMRISYAVFCLKKKKNKKHRERQTKHE